MQLLACIWWTVVALAAIQGSLVQCSPDVKTRPRVVIGYVSGADWAFVEFLCMTHASWRYVTALDGAGQYKLDLLAVVDPRWSTQLATLCEPLMLDASSPAPSTMNHNKSQCWSLVYPPPNESVWHGYPFINNVHFFSDPLLTTFLTHEYGLAMKTDFDTFLSPTLLHFFPDKFRFGVQEYVVMEETVARLGEVADTLGLSGPVHHNLGPTWYGDVRQLLLLAQQSIPIMQHILTHEFEQKPEGGVKQRWFAGEGWPAWSAGAAALYASELAANHYLADFQATREFDEHGDSQGLVAAVYHIHCRHGDRNFSKIEFLQHHYKTVDLKTLDLSVIADYATFLAVSTWRQLVDMQVVPGDAVPQSAAGHLPSKDEL